MNGVAQEVAAISRVVRDVLEGARAEDAGSVNAKNVDAGAADAVREAIIEVGRAAQGQLGMLPAPVGEGDRLSIARGGIGPWLATVPSTLSGARPRREPTPATRPPVSMGVLGVLGSAAGLGLDECVGSARMLGAGMLPQPPDPPTT